MRMRFFAATFALAALFAMSAGADAASRYVGTYATMRPGADGTQAITLVLFLDGRAALTTSYPDLARSVGPGVLPISEVGTWRDRGATAEVHLTAFGLVRNGAIVNPKHDNNTMSFALAHCRLTAVRYSKVTYGEAGLSLDKNGCR
ncbi:MAG: hypothetical protein M3169_02635 [Candidatus Eremiobacteraeota bacterium]|nr:hypothetical protein [Candidatus Eremiobacteraeota bacterium]